MLTVASSILFLSLVCNGQTVQAQTSLDQDCPGLGSFNVTLQRKKALVDALLTWKTPSVSAGAIASYSFTVCSSRVSTCNVYKDLSYDKKNLTVENLEYWTGYSVTAYVFCNDSSNIIRSQPTFNNTNTGKGAPSKPPYFFAFATNATAALLRWFDPAGHRKQPTDYRVEVCPSSGTCFNRTKKRSGSDAYPMQLSGLSTKATYTVRLYAVIHDSETYESDPAEVSFTTPDHEYEPLLNLKYTLENKQLDKVDVKLQWEAPASNATPCCYRIKACDVNNLCTTHEVTSTELTLKDKPYFSTITILGSACYSTSDSTLCSEGTSVTATTGSGKPPAPEYIDVKLAAPTFGTVMWTDPVKGSRQAPNFYNVTLCQRQGQCHDVATRQYHKNETYSVTVNDLVPGTSYIVQVFAVVRSHGNNYTSHPASFHVTTPQSDFLAPANFKASIGRKEEKSTSISLSWDVPPHAHRNLTAYYILVCTGVNVDCAVEVVAGDATSFVVQKAPYWQDYTISASALFEDYGATIGSPSVSQSVSTGPVGPWVDNLNVTAGDNSNIVVTWEGSKNGHVSGYNVTVCQAKAQTCDVGIVAPNCEEKYQLIFYNLVPWTETGVTIYAYYSYEKAWYNGTKQDKSIRTSPADPDPVRKATYAIKNLTIAEFRWEKPSVLRGPLGGYNVVCDSLHDEQPLHFEKNVEASVTGVSINLTEQQTDFQCNITAYNFYQQKKYVGPPVILTPHTKGIHAPTHLNITHLNATAITLTWDVDPKAKNCSVQFNPSNDAVTRTCATNDDNNTHTFEGDHLQPWTAYNITVRNCGDNYCGKKGILHARTDPSAPSEVAKFEHTLEAYVDVTFKWAPPEKPNGPIDGYLLNITNLERQQEFSYEIAGAETTFSTNLTDPYTKYEASISAFNNDSHHDNILYGPPFLLNVSTEGEGAKPPYPDPTELDSNDAVIQWEAPKDRNHTIVSYYVNVTDQKEHEVSNATVKVTNITIHHLQPWSNYTVAIESCTGNSTCGPVYKVAHFRTDVAAPSAPRNLKSKDVTKDSVTVSWEKPSVDNGPITGYIVNWTYEAGKTTSNDTTKTEFKITGLPASTKCSIKVVAFNKGYKEDKRGTAATLDAVTLPSVATSTIVLAVILPLLAIAAVVGGVVAYKKHQSRRAGMTLLQNQE